jgi:hypothetical protein
MGAAVPAEQHVLLFVEVVNGKPLKEPVHAADLGGGRFRLLYSPGLVQGIAAGDEFRLRDEDGRFEILSRAGNLALQVFSKEPVAPLRAELVARVAALNGRLDGEIAKGLAFTIPLAAGFAAIEAVFNRWVQEHPGWEWYYGDVYSTADGVTPLNWWLPNSATR